MKPTRMCSKAFAVMRKPRKLEIYPVRLGCVLISKIGFNYGCLRHHKSSRQVVIPEEVRNDLGLNEGDQFVVIGQGDAVKHLERK